MLRDWLNHKPWLTLGLCVLAVGGMMASTWGWSAVHAEPGVWYRDLETGRTQGRRFDATAFSQDVVRVHRFRCEDCDHRADGYLERVPADTSRDELEFGRPVVGHAFSVDGKRWHAAGTQAAGELIRKARRACMRCGKVSSWQVWHP